MVGIAEIKQLGQEIEDLCSEISSILDPDFVELFLHTELNGKEYAGAFSLDGVLNGLCDEPFNGGCYTDEGAKITDEMAYILAHPDQFSWWFSDAVDLYASLNEVEEKFNRVRSLLDSMTSEDTLKYLFEVDKNENNS